MTKSRLEAFSDGFVAILMTVMVLELRPPPNATLHALAAMLPTFLSYLLSFVMVAIYWNNHHHTLHAAKRINGPILWANHHLLFWLSLIPFVTSWMGTDHVAPLPTFAYGCVMIGSALSYNILVTLLIKADGGHSRLQAAIGRVDWKGHASSLMYLVSLPLAFVHTSICHLLFLGVAAVWFVPDRRLEDATESAAH